MNFPPENLRNPAHNRRAGLMRQFSSGQLYSRKLRLAILYNVREKSGPKLKN
jgi:hypothetical protein